MTAAVAYRSNTPTGLLRPVTTRSATRSQRPKRTARPKLRVLDQVAIRRRARRRNAAIGLFMVLLSGLFVVAFVHAHLVASQQELDQKRSQIAELENERARLERSVDEASSPALIVDRAAELGMIRAAQPVFLVSVEPAAEPVVGSAPSVPIEVAEAPTTLGSESVEESALGGIGDG
jgi:cell division protein FtsL